MRVDEVALAALGHLPRGAVAALERRLSALPPVRRRLEREYEALIGELEGDLKPYRGDYASHTRIPAQACDPESLLQELEEMRAREEARWREGYVSGAVYHGDPEHVDFMNRVYASQSQSNPLHPDVWPSGAKFEAEIVAMTASHARGRR